MDGDGLVNRSSSGTKRLGWNVFPRRLVLFAFRRRERIENFPQRIAGKMGVQAQRRNKFDKICYAVLRSCVSAGVVPRGCFWRPGSMHWRIMAHHPFAIKGLGPRRVSLRE